MKLTIVEDIIIKLELAQKLKEIGLPQDSLYSWVIIKPKKTHTQFKDWGTDIKLKRTPHPSTIKENKYWDHEWVSAYTVSELAIYLPENTYMYFQKGENCTLSWFCMNMDDTAPIVGDRLQDTVGEYIVKNGIKV